MPLKSSAHPRSLQSCSFTAYNVRAPSMLTSSMTSRYFSCQSIRIWPLTHKSATLGRPIPSEVLLGPPRDPSFEKMQAEWIVTPSIRAAAVPDVAVTSRQYPIPLLANSAATASTTRDFPVPPSPPTKPETYGLPL